MAIAIRKHVVSDLSLDDYAAASAFDEAKTVGLDDASETDRELQAILDAGDVAGFLRKAVQARKNVIVSGGTSTGKTTFLNALVKEIPLDERLIVIEDTPEVRLDHPNAVGLIAARGSLGRGPHRRGGPAAGLAAHAAGPHHPGRTPRGRRPTASCAR
jgi:type IV secretion system protein VirB11